jgi:hypothetical protein
LPMLTRTVNGLEGAVCTRIFTAVYRYGTARSPTVNAHSYAFAKD